MPVVDGGMAVVEDGDFDERVVDVADGLSSRVPPPGAWTRRFPLAIAQESASATVPADV
jgi:hypothetical protein